MNAMSQKPFYHRCKCYSRLQAVDVFFLSPHVMMCQGLFVTKKKVKHFTDAWFGALRLFGLKNVPGLCSLSETSVVRVIATAVRDASSDVTFLAILAQDRVNRGAKD